MAGTIHIHRAEVKWKDRFRAYKILADEDVVAEVRNGESISFEVSPGEHAIYAKLDWMKTEPVVLTVSDGETVHLGVESVAFPSRRRLKEDPSGLRGMKDLGQHLFGKNGYLSLSRVDPPSDVG